MKKKLLLLSAFSLSFLFQFSQTSVSTIDDVILLPDTFYNGSDNAGGFQSGNIYYHSVYDTSFGGFWSSGFAASSKTDSVTSGYLNMYSAKPAGGCLGSSSYAIGQNNSVFKLTGTSAGDSIYGFYLTNTTYAYNSMRDGDWVSKKFGGTTGNDPDWFLLTVKKYYGGALTSDSVIFYLADYRFNNNSNDYILKSWQWVNCETLGMADSLLFSLTSSDTGAFGMNTPGFFAIDNVTTRASMVGIKESSAAVTLNVYPNPSADLVRVNLNGEIKKSVHFQLYDLNGRLLLNEKKKNIGDFQLNVSDLESGQYILKVFADEEVYNARINKY